MLPFSPLFAFQLTHWAVLGWMAAAAAPILIHLWSRRRYREMSWAAMEYLLAALRHSRRRMSLEQWLLLLLRTAAIVLIVLAAAEPLTQGFGLVASPGERTHRMIVLDGSFSMAYRPTDRSRFERAREMAAKIVDESSEGDGFTLVLLSAPPRVVVGTPALQRRDFLRELENLDLPHTTADLPATLAKVEEVLAEAKREAPRLSRHEIYFVTDLGRVGWGMDRLDAAIATDVRKRSERLAESAQLVVIDVGQPDAENLAVTSLQSADAFASLTQDYTIHAQLKNFGRQPHSRLPVALWADGRRVRQTQVDLAAGGEAGVSLAHRFDTPGDHVLEVRIDGDRLEVDNHRWLAVPVKQSLRVLCIDGRPAGDPARGAASYVAAALAPDRDDASRGFVRPEIRTESALTEMPLTPYDCIFLCNVAQFTSGESRILDAYLRGGGSLVFFLGDQVRADRYNEVLASSEADGVRILPARLGSIVNEQTNLNPLDYRHPILQPFRGQQRSGLLTTPIAKQYALELPENSNAKVALATASGRPLIVEEPIHRGRVFLVATSADMSWTAWPVWPSFLPIVQEMLAYAVGGQMQQQNLAVGESLSGWLPLSAGDAPYTIRPPDGRSEEGRARLERDSAAWTSPATRQSGVYTVEFGPPAARTQSFAVNVNPVESDLASITEEELRDEVWPGVPFVHQTTWQQIEAPQAASVTRRSELAKLLLYVVLGLLLVETYLARRFGHYT